MSAKRKWLRDPLFLGIVLLQAAIFGFIGSDRRADSLTARQLAAPFSRAVITQGGSLPDFTAYDQQGARQMPLTGKRAATIIFKKDCTCDTDTLRRWIESARRRGEEATTVVLCAPEKLVKVAKEHPTADRHLAIRHSAFSGLGLTHEQLPVALHVSTRGTVLAVETSG